MTSAPAPRWKARLMQAAEDAQGAGWELCPGRTMSTLRKVTRHATPDFARDNGWWPLDTFEHVESLTFVPGPGNRTPKVVHRVHKNPWTNATDTFISFKAALAILAK